MIEPGSDAVSGPETQARKGGGHRTGTVVDLTDAICLIGRFPALAGVTLRIAEGETVVLQGPNGAGKTTLLRLLAGLAPLHDGQATVLDCDLHNRVDRRRLRRQCGLLSHKTFLYDELTVEENLRFWANANRIDLSTIEPVLDRLGLGGRLRDVPVSGLSTGQRRRASLAVVVCRRPRLWLLDEPHAGLDHAARDFVDTIVGQAVGFGATVVMASHDLDRANSLATRVVELVGGRVAQSENGKGSAGRAD